MGWLKKNFLNDEDGLSAKDYLMLVFTTPYILGWVAVLITMLTGHTVSNQVIDLLASMNGIEMTIVGGWFGYQAVSAFANAYGQRTTTPIPVMQQAYPTTMTTYPTATYPTTVYPTSTPTGTPYPTATTQQTVVTQTTTTAKLP
jgi:hypothetical protein